MESREDIGYITPKHSEQQKQDSSIIPKVKVSPEKRKEINEWAEGKAYELAKELGKVRSLTDYDEIRAFDTFISNETLNFERQAFLKIYERDNT